MTFLNLIKGNLPGYNDRIGHLTVSSEVPHISQQYFFILLDVRSIHGNGHPPFDIQVGCGLCDRKGKVLQNSDKISSIIVV